MSESEQGVVQQQPPPPQQPQLRGVCGLVNLGNTCYMNSVIQIVRAMPEWANIFTDTPLIERIKESPTAPAKVLYAFIELTKAMWGCTAPMTCRPFAFYQKIQEVVKGTIYEDFGRPLPHDGHEYMTYLLDQAHEGMKETIAAPEDATPAAAAWASIWASGYSQIADATFGLDRVVCRCNACGHESARWEHFNMLKIPIPGPGQTLLDVISAERAPLLIAEYKCDKCGPGSATMTREFYRLPPNLIVVFDRFTATRQKIHTAVNYDGAPISFAPHFADAAEHKSRTWVYEPLATLDHMGNHIGGHYACTVRNFVENSWLTYDDMRATAVRGAEFGATTYIIVIRRQSVGDS